VGACLARPTKVAWAKHCRAGSLPHSKLAKDSPIPSGCARWQLNAFDAAFKLADRASTEFLLPIGLEQRRTYARPHTLEVKDNRYPGLGVGGFHRAASMTDHKWMIQPMNTNHRTNANTNMTNAIPSRP
jgi:hypothetical protein